MKLLPGVERFNPLAELSSKVDVAEDEDFTVTEGDMTLITDGLGLDFDIMVGGKHVGNIGLQGRCLSYGANADYVANVYYSLEPEARGKGYATKALCLFKQIARLCGLAEVDLWHTPDNLKSRAVMVRAGAYPRESYYCNYPAMSLSTETA